MTFAPTRNILNCGFGVSHHQNWMSGRLEELDQVGREYNLEIPSRAAPSIPFRFLFQSHSKPRSDDVGGVHTEACPGIQRPSSNAAVDYIRPSTQLSRHSSEMEEDCSQLCTSCSVLLPSVFSKKQPLRGAIEVSVSRLFAACSTFASNA